MAKKKATKPVPVFQLGDYVFIRHTHWPRGRIIELRGPLGPGGCEIYRVRIGKKPYARITEVRGDQLELAPTAD